MPFSPLRSPKLLVLACREPRLQRVKDELLLRALLTIPGFQRYGERLQSIWYEQRIAQYFQVVRVKKHKAVFNYGEVGNSFFVLLIGQCFLVKPRLVSNWKEEEVARVHAVLPGIRSIRQQIEEQQSAQEQSAMSALTKEEFAFLNNNFRTYQFTSVLREGAQFGEISLICNSRRAATVISREQSYLLSLAKEGYYRIFGHEHVEATQAQLREFRKFQFFAGYQLETLFPLQYDMTRRSYRLGATIYREHDPVSQIYFVFRGQVQILKPRADPPAHQKQARAASDRQRSQDKRKTFAPFVLKQEGGYFGDEEVFANLPQRTSQAVAFSNDVEIFSLEKNKFIFYLERYNDAYQFLQDYLNVHSWHQSRSVQRPEELRTPAESAELEQARLKRKVIRLSAHNKLDAISGWSNHCKLLRDTPSAEFDDDSLSVLRPQYEPSRS